ncbi:MAG: hypothetical protein QM765_02035 [Myxococcales bacterium]
MYRKDVNARSPLRILEQSIHGGLGKGNLGVLVAPAGVGKTACLVQIGLDDLMRERDVVHIALGQTVEYVSAFYDTLFEDLAKESGLEEKEAVRDSVSRRRAIKTYKDGASFSPLRLEEVLKLFTQHMNLTPAAILIDGYDCPASGLPTALEAFKATAKRIGAELWMTVTAPRGFLAPVNQLPAPLEGSCSNLVDVALFLEPRGGHVALRLLKDHGDAKPPETHLELHPDTLQIIPEGQVPAPKRLPAAGFTLLSGGAPGAECEFGLCAERWGLGEVNYSFAGRGPVRSRGMVELTEDELVMGDVSSTYLKAHMHRSYPSTPLFRKVLQSIWHQVNTAGEVFSIGQIMPDSTVKGGTGWAVELARHWNKPVHVFDQDKRDWFAFKDGKWQPVEPPSITRERFAGTGTRFLSDEGRNAVRALFERSFGSPKS